MQLELKSHGSSLTGEDETLRRKWVRDKEPLRALTVGEWGCLQLTHVFCDLGSEIWQVLSKAREKAGKTDF